jgi:hypothetical protein
VEVVGEGVFYVRMGWGLFERTLGEGVVLESPWRRVWGRIFVDFGGRAEETALGERLGGSGRER